MKVTLRERKIKNNQRSLYLDFYPPIIVDGKPTRRDFLKLYVYDKPRDETQREHNKETRMLAGNIRAKKQLEFQANPHGFTTTRTGAKDFIAFLRDYISTRRNKSESIHESWRSVELHFVDFCGEPCPFNKIDKEFVEGFRDFLLTTLPYKTKRSLDLANSRSKSPKKTLAPSSAKMYYERFTTVVKEAYRKHHLSSDPTADVETIKRKTPKRDFFTLDELQSLVQTKCNIPDDFRRASFFSALTGLRHIDIRTLTWANVRGSAKSGFYLDFLINKTEQQDFMPISEEARELLGKAGAQNENVFPGMRYNGNTNYWLEKWTKAAGIERRITFHAFRRTFATGQITLGTDLYTVQKMLGHADIRMTQLYAHLVDSKKREAASKMTLK